METGRCCYGKGMCVAMETGCCFPGNRMGALFSEVLCADVIAGLGLRWGSGPGLGDDEGLGGSLGSLPGLDRLRGSGVHRHHHQGQGGIRFWGSTCAITLGSQGLMVTPRGLWILGSWGSLSLKVIPRGLWILGVLGLQKTHGHSRESKGQGGQEVSRIQGFFGVQGQGVCKSRGLGSPWASWPGLGVHRSWQSMGITRSRGFRGPGGPWVSLPFPRTSGVPGIHEPHCPSEGFRGFRGSGDP